MPNVRPNDRPSFKLSYPFFSHAFFRLRSKSENFLREVDRDDIPIDLNEMSLTDTPMSLGMMIDPQTIQL